MNNKSRTISTILSALLCVVIGLIIGFLVLVALAYVDKNNTYQQNVQTYESGQYPRADMIRTRKYLEEIDKLEAEEANHIRESVTASMNGKYDAATLYQVVQHVLNDNAGSVKFYTKEQISAAVSAALAEDNVQAVDEATPVFMEGIRHIMLKRYEFSFGDVISDAYNKGFKAVLQGGWYSMGDEPLGPRNEIADAAPLIMTGLSVAFAFMTGLFNIGAAGQYTVGAFGALLFSLVLKCPWYVCVLAAIVFGAIWGSIPGIFKAYFNVNEVITSIMFNWIGLYAVNTIMYGGGNSPMFSTNDSKTFRLDVVSPQSKLPDLSGLGSNYFVQPATIAIFLAIIVAIVLWILLNKTTFGYELKACGYSKTAARYAGINEKRNIILSMTIAGALAGLGGALYCLSGSVQWNPQDSTALPAVGFNGISVALLASSNPIGSIFSAMFISHITIGGTKMDQSIFPKEVASIISGVIIYLCSFMMLFKNRISRLFTLKRKGDVK